MREHLAEAETKLSPSSIKWIWTTQQATLLEFLRSCQSVLEIVVINPHTIMFKYIDGVLELPDIHYLDLSQDVAGKTIVKVITGSFTGEYGAIIYRDADDGVDYFVVELLKSGNRVRYDSSELIVYA